MTFKLTEKDIKAIEAFVNDYLSQDVSSHPTARDCVGLRRAGVDLPRKKWSRKSRNDASRSHSSRWAALREFEAREAAR